MSRTAQAIGHAIALELGRGRVRCLLRPDLGGSIVKLEVDSFDILRPAPTGATEVQQVSSFPLIPFANRIAFGRFDVPEGAIRLPPDPEGAPHALHGHGWRRAWNVHSLAGSCAVLEMDEDHTGWPWRYRARQRFVLVPGGLRLEMMVRNKSTTPMPIGAGIHPYFRRNAGSAVCASASAMWRNSPDGVAGSLVPDARFSPDEPVLVTQLEGADNFFYTCGRDVIVTGGILPVALRASDSSGFHLYAPRDQDFFCVEPVSHEPNSFARPPIPPSQWLRPQEERAWIFEILAT